MTNKAELKREIANLYGFATNKINLLEISWTMYGRADYVMFEVCGMEYQIDSLIDIKLGLINKQDGIRIYK